MVKIKELQNITKEKEQTEAEPDLSLEQELPVEVEDL
jgi:hypothetical protein